MKKSIAVLGMGRFGQFLTAELSKNGADVLIADDNDENIRKFANQVSCAIRADLNDPEVIRSLGLAGVDTVVVSMGSSLDASIMCVMVAKEMGVPYVIAKAASLRMGEILRRVGADEIIYPEKQMADWAAVRYTGDHVYDYTRLSPDYAIYETEIPDNWIGHTAVDLSIRQRYRLNILALRRNGNVDPMFGPSTILQAGDRVILLGSDKDVQKFLRF